MAYDAKVASRLRDALKECPGIQERKMFGGLAFLLDGNMCCGVVDKNIVLRLGKEGTAEALRQRHTRVMDFTGKPLSTMVYLRPAGYRDADDLIRWATRAIEYTKTLSAK